MPLFKKSGDPDFQAFRGNTQKIIKKNFLLPELAENYGLGVYPHAEHDAAI